MTTAYVGRLGSWISRFRRGDGTRLQFLRLPLVRRERAAGKHIFSQKPFAYNIEEGRKIIRAVDEAGVKLTPSFMHSYMDGSIAARRIVEEGKIGEIRHIRMRNATKNPFDSAPGYGGCMMDIGCHGMDCLFPYLPFVPVVLRGLSGHAR